jgi:flagellar hook-basal body complex protein FliE
MIIPPVGGIGASLSIGQTGGVAQAASTASAQAASTAPAQSALPAEGATPVEGAAPLEGAAPVEGGTTPAEGASGGESFGSELTEAISSLEKTQQSSDSAAQALASGSVKDPASAVVTVEDAQMAMQLASQIRTKAAEAAQSIFQTQV